MAVAALLVAVATAASLLPGTAAALHGCTFSPAASGSARASFRHACLQACSAQEASSHDLADLHHHWMMYALQLAERGRLSTAPNPWVGCVIVAADGRTLLAEGFHKRKGGAHAEAAALANAEARSVGREELATGTAYVTLEPCHRGPGKTTPPCDEALVDSGLRDVHVALLDPDPAFGNAGVEYLRSAGVRVTVGTGAAEVAASLRPYLYQRVRRVPWVVLKVASSVDGAIACEDDTSQWITGPEARAHSQLLRASSQAIIVGSGTAVQDKPRLTVRLSQGALPEDWLQPSAPLLRVVLDSRGRLTRGPLLDTTDAPTLVCTTDAASPATLEAWRSGGVQVAVLPEGRNGVGVDLDSVLVELYARGVIQVMVEGGGTLMGAWMQHDSARQLRVYLGACVLGSTAKRWVQAPVASTIAKALRVKLVDNVRLGDDMCMDYSLGDADAAR